MMNSWYEFEGGSDSYEFDDVLFDDLRKQVLQLTADDDDEQSPGLGTKQGFNRPVTVADFHVNPRNKSTTVEQLGLCQYEWTDNKDGSRVPEWLLELWRTENKDTTFNGTGVFIPHIVNTRRRYKPRKKNNEKRRVYKPVAKVN